MALSHQVQPITAARSLKLVCFALLACSATRPVCQDRSKHLTNGSASQVFPARSFGKDSAAATNLLQQHQASADPESSMEEVNTAAEALKTRLQDEGELHSSMKDADTEATQLLEAAKEFSTLAKGIENATKKVTDTAAETSEKLQEAHNVVKDNAEAEVGKVSSENLDKATGDQEKHANQANKNTDDSEGTSLLSTGASVAGDGRSSNGSQATGNGEKEIEELMGNLRTNYGKLETLIGVSDQKAQVAKESAEKWATEPVEKYKAGAEFAKAEATKVAKEMSTGNDALKDEVEAHVNQVLDKHFEGKTEDSDKPEVLTVTEKPEVLSVTEKPNEDSL